MAQTTEAELMRALDATEVISTLNQQVTELEQSLSNAGMTVFAQSQHRAQLHWNIGALLRDGQFQRMIEEMERRKAMPDKLIGENSFHVEYNVAAAFQGADDTATDAPIHAVRADDSLATMKGDKPFLVVEVTDTAFCMFQRRVATMDKSFIKMYPWVASQIRSGRIGLEFRYDPKPVKHAVLAAPMIFPTNNAKGADNAQKMKVAEDYLAFIRSQCEEVKCFKRDLADSYFALERKKIPDRNLDKIIDMRQKFSSHLRAEARKCNER